MANPTNKVNELQQKLSEVFVLPILVKSTALIAKSNEVLIESVNSMIIIAGNTANNAVVTARQAQDNGVNQMMMNLANALGQTQGSQSKAASTSA